MTRAVHSTTTKTRSSLHSVASILGLQSSKTAPTNPLLPDADAICFLVKWTWYTSKYEHAGGLTILIQEWPFQHVPVLRISKCQQLMWNCALLPNPDHHPQMWSMAFVCKRARTGWQLLKQFTWRLHDLPSTHWPRTHSASTILQHREHPSNSCFYPAIQLCKVFQEAFNETVYKESPMLQNGVSVLTAISIGLVKSSALINLGILALQREPSSTSSPKKQEENSSSLLMAPV